MTSRRRGLLFLGIGLLFTGVFLIGGGVITSTNGGYWTSVFLITYVMGLLFPGPIVYWSAKSKTPTSVPPKSNPGLLLGLVTFAASSVLSPILFSSEFFVSSLGQHVFLALMGFCLAQFIPLGLGFLHSESDQPTSTVGA